MIEVSAMGSMGANCYLFACNETKHAVIIDPGAEGERILSWVKDKGLTVDYILLTHGHVDHIGAVDELRGLLEGVKVGIHIDDAEMLTDAEKNLSCHFRPKIELQKADFLFEDGHELKIGNETLTVIFTPGHSPGSVCFLSTEGLFSGDTLFKGSIGRTNFPGGSREKLIEGVKGKLLILPEETLVFPGHGGKTQIGIEKRNNPFLS